MHKKRTTVRKLILTLSLLITGIVLPGKVPRITGAQTPAAMAELLALAQVGTTSGLYLSTRSVHESDGGNWVLVEPARVLKVTPEGATSTFHTFPDNPTGLVLSGGYVAINVSHDLAFDASGNLLVAYSHLDRIDKITPEGSVSTFATGLVSPHSPTLDSSGNLYVSTRSVHESDGGNWVLVEPAKVLKVTPEGATSTFHTFPDNPTGLVLSDGTTPNGYVAINVSHDLAFDASGNLLVAYSHLDRIDKITPEGSVSTFAAGPVSPHSPTFDSSGNLYVSTRSVHESDGGNWVLVEPARVLKVTPEGATSTFHTFPDNPMGSVLSGGYVAINVSHDLAFDASGNLLVAYSHLDRIDKITPEGSVSTFATGPVSPHSLAFKLKPSWTLMFYLDGDNNLDSSYPPIFNQLEAAANTPNAQVVALWDRYGSNDSAYYKVQYDTNLNNPATYTANVDYWPKGELNMGDPDTLVDFVNWARAKYPAQYYALILTDHGNGLGGAMWDDTDGRDYLTLSEVGTALASATLDGADKINVLYMDACLMAMVEDAYQVQDYVGYYVASENVQWAYSEPYFQYVSGITATTPPAQLATLFTTSYADVGDAYSDPYTISAADISALNSVVAATNSLAQLLNSQMTTSAITLTTVLSTVQRFEMNGDHIINLSDDYIDLYDFARLTKSNFSDKSIQAAAQGMMDGINAYIMSERHRSGRTWAGSWDLGNSQGVSVFFPATASSFYNASNYDFATGAVWPGGTSPLLSSDQATIAWGPMLVNYFQTTQPGGPDNPTPPQPLPRWHRFRVYLPVVVKE